MNDEELKKEIHSLFGDAQATDGGYQSLYDGKWIDMTDEVCAVADFITADRKRVALEASDREARLLNALAGMYEQYCGKKYGHDFMGAGEEAINILEDYGVHDEAWEWDEKSDENLSRALARIKAQQEEV